MTIKEGLFWSVYYKHKTRALKLKGFKDVLTTSKTDYNQFLSLLDIYLKTENSEEQEEEEKNKITKSFRRRVKRQILKQQNKKLRASLNYRIAHSSLLFNEKKFIIPKVDTTRNKSLLFFSNKVNAYDCVNLLLGTQNYDELINDYQIRGLSLSYLNVNSSKLKFYLLKKNIKC